MSAFAQFLGWVLIVGALAWVVSVPMSASTLTLCVLLAGVGAAIIVWVRQRDAEEADARSDWSRGKNSWWFLLLLILAGSVNAVKALYAHELGRYVLGGLVIIVVAFGVRGYLRFRQNRRSRWSAKNGAPPAPIVMPRGDDPDVVRAAALGKHETVKQLIALGAHLDVEGCGTTDDSALIAAVRSGSKETVEVLLAAGADVNRGTDDSALIAAVRSGSKDTVEVLLAAGADVNLGIDWDDGWKDGRKTPFSEAVSCGNHDLLRLLLDRGARVPDLRSQFDSGVEEGILMLFEIGEDALARDLGRAAVGVELPRPDAERIERARLLGSVFAAFAEWFKSRGDRSSAKRLCEWKVERWKGIEYGYDGYFGYSMKAVVVCLRTLASVHELEGNAQEALRLCRTAVRTWRKRDFDRLPPYYEDSIFYREDVAQQSLTDQELRRTLGLVDKVGRDEFAALLRQCEQVLGSLRMQEEQRSVAATLQLLEIA